MVAESPVRECTASSGQPAGPCPSYRARSFAGEGASRRRNGGRARINCRLSSRPSAARHCSNAVARAAPGATGFARIHAVSTRRASGDLLARDTAATRQLIETSAAAARAPPEIWVRVAVEAARLVAEIASYTGRLTSLVVAELDSASATPPARRDVLGGSALDRYVDRLRPGHAARRVPEQFALRLPEEMTDTWRRDAARQRLTMPEWVAERLKSAPSTCLR